MLQWFLILVPVMATLHVAFVVFFLFVYKVYRTSYKSDTN
jgi:hypothetical protein